MEKIGICRSGWAMQLTHFYRNGLPGMNSTAMNVGDRYVVPQANKRYILLIAISFDDKITSEGFNWNIHVM